MSRALVGLVVLATVAGAAPRPCVLTADTADALAEVCARVVPMCPACPPVVCPADGMSEAPAAVTLHCMACRTRAGVSVCHKCTVVVPTG
jgi:hypothetical protein